MHIVTHILYNTYVYDLNKNYNLVNWFLNILSMRNPYIKSSI